MKPIVFLGPSLARSEAEAVLDADYRAPAAAGDIFAASRGEPPAIVLIDGYFARVPAVWHKEILYALDRGVPVYGAASMGALRAAELHGFGMIGVGSIFERFRDGVLEDDDEVAVLHAPETFGFRALSDAMVNLRDGIAQAVHEEIIGGDDAETLLRWGKALFYPQRTWARLAAAGEECGLARTRMSELCAWAREHVPNAKRDDALAALARARDDLQSQRLRAPVDFIFERTVFWERLVDSLSGESAGAATHTSVMAWAKLRGPGPDWHLGMLRHLLRLEARRRGWQAAPAGVTAALTGLRQDQGLLDEPAFADWLAARDLDREALVRLMEDELLMTELAAVDRRAIEQALLDHLKISSEWARLTEVAAAQDAAVLALGTAAPLPQDAGLDESAVLAWYARTFQRSPADVERHALALGFAGSTEFMVAVVRAYLADPAAGGAMSIPSRGDDR